MASNLLHVASLNVRGINSRYKRLLVFDHFKTSKFAIILLQETKTTFRNENKIKREWHNHRVIINSTKSENASGGCMILFNSHNIIVLDTILTSDGKCIVVDFELNGSRYHLVNTYFPNDTSDQKAFILSLYPLVSSQYPIILGGDFNLALNSNIDRYPVRNYKDAHVTDLESLIDTFDLHDACRKLYPFQPFYSFRRGQTKSRIDHFFISKNCIIDSYQHQDFSSSDHDIISVSIVIQNTLCRGKGFWKNRTKIYDSENFIDKFKEFWDQNLKKNWKRYSGSWWLETKFQIKKFLIKVNREFEDAQNEEIRSTKISLERKKFLANIDPENKSLSKKYYECKEDLAKKQISMIQNKVMHDQVFDITHGDLPTKTFFEKLKKLKSNCEPKQVYTEDGTIEKTQLKWFM